MGFKEQSVKYPGLGVYQYEISFLVSIKKAEGSALSPEEQEPKPKMVTVTILADSEDEAIERLAYKLERLCD